MHLYDNIKINSFDDFIKSKANITERMKSWEKLSKIWRRLGIFLCTSSLKYFNDDLRQPSKQHVEASFKFLVQLCAYWGNEGII